VVYVSPEPDSDDDGTVMLDTLDGAGAQFTLYSADYEQLQVVNGKVGSGIGQ
jgi:hypothetical protein